MPGGAGDVRVVGTTAYVANRFPDSLHVVDASDPTAPRLVETVTTLGSPGGVHVVGSTVCVADGDGGLVVLEAQPKRLYMPSVLCAEGT